MLHLRARLREFLGASVLIPALAGLAFAALLAATPMSLWGQTTISTGSIQGTVNDQSGAVVPGASVTVSSQAMGRSIKLVTTGSGTYSSGALIPGDYVVQVEAKGFKTVTLPVTVQVGTTSPAM